MTYSFSISDQQDNHICVPTAKIPAGSDLSLEFRNAPDPEFTSSEYCIKFTISMSDADKYDGAHYDIYATNAYQKLRIQSGVVTIEKKPNKIATEYDVDAVAESLTNMINDKYTNGVAGPKGDTGPPGPKGDPGLPGSNGSNGSTGLRGSLWNVTTGSPVVSGLSNDQALDSNTGDIYSYNGSSWTKVANIKGPQGSIGPPGAAAPVNVATLSADLAGNSSSITLNTLSRLEHMT